VARPPHAPADGHGHFHDGELTGRVHARHCQAVLQHDRKLVASRMTPRSRFAILVGTNQPRSAKIMLTERGKLFEEKEPSLSDDEVSAAYENGKIAASLKGKPRAR
jgi:hypothetical protein